MALLSVNSLAELLGLDPRRVQQLAKEGIIPRADRGKYDAILCVQAYVRFLRESARGKDPESIKIAKATAEENRRIKELIRLEREKKLVNIEEANQEFGEHVAVAKALFRGMPAKCAQKIYQIKTSEKSQRVCLAKIQEELLKEINEVLTELSKWKPLT